MKRSAFLATTAILGVALVAPLKAVAAVNPSARVSVFQPGVFVRWDERSDAETCLEERDPPARTGARAGDHARRQERVDLRTATVAELLALPGVGPVRARAIVALRERGRLRQVRDLRRVKGIGPKTLRKLAPLVTLSPPPAKLTSRPDTHRSPGPRSTR